VHVRRTVLLGTVAALVAAVLALTWHRVEARRCGADVTAVEHPVSPLLSPALMRQRPDRHRDRLAAVLGRLGPPFGRVLGAVDYYYEQGLHLYGVPGGALAWTKRNAPVTMLSGDDLHPVWALRPARARVAWDASADDFVLLTLSAKQPVEVLDHDLATGERRWCARLPVANADGDPLSTSILADGSVVVAARGPGDTDTTLLRLSPTGEQVWQRTSRAVDRADYVGAFGDLVVVGGREEFRLGEDRPVAAGDVVSAFDAASGRPAWGFGAPAGVHVVGVTRDALVLLEDGAAGADGARLVALDTGGDVVWSRSLPGAAGRPLQTTLRGEVLLVKAPDRLAAYDADTGSELWHRSLPATFTPYGFTLAMMPSLDATHLLVPTTTQLRVLDLRTGRHRAYPLPTDGINTTYWPYQLLATDQLLGVVTNTGAVVVRRAP
jgi:hypothetical protein